MIELSSGNFLIEDGVGDMLYARPSGTSVVVQTSGYGDEPGIGPIVVLDAEERVALARFLLQGTGKHVAKGES